MVKITVRQVTDGFDIEDVADYRYDEPKIATTDMPRFRFTVPLGGGVNSHRLAAGKEIQIKRSGEVVFPGYITRSTPQGGRNPSVEVEGIHKGYHHLRRFQADDFDHDEDGDPSTTRDGVTVNPWNWFIYREPASTLDVYGNGYPVHGVNVTDAVRAMCGTRFVYQHSYEDNSHLLPSDIYTTTNTLQVYRDGPSGDLRPMLQRVREDADSFEGTTAITADPSDSSGNGYNLTVVGSPTSREAPNAKYTAGYNFDGTDDCLQATQSALLVGGDLSIFWAGEVDDATPASPQYMLSAGDAGAAPSADRRIYYAIRVNTNGTLAYFHLTGTTFTTLTSTATVSTGSMRVTLRRDDNGDGTGTVTVKVNGTDFIGGGSGVSGAYTQAPPSDGLQNAFRIGCLSFGGTDTNFLDGGVYEVRVWDSLVAQATLDQLADPTDTTHDRIAEGNELALWYLDVPPTPATVESIPLMNGDPYVRGMGAISTVQVVLVGERSGADDPVIEVCRDAGDASGSSLQNNATRTYTSVTLTHTASYNGSGLSAWTGSVDLSGDAAIEKGMLGYRIGIEGVDGNAATTKIHYVSLTATTASDVDLTEGTAETYSNGSTITGLRGGAAGNERDWVEGDFLGMRRHEAIERLRSATESAEANNPSPHWDFHVDADLAYHWQERRGSDKTREYSVAEENLISRPQHEYWGEEVAYQTIAYGAGSGIARTRIVSKTAFSSGGLYDSDRDPTTGSATETELANLARVMEFVDQDERSVVALLRKARASHKLRRNLIEKFSVEVLAEHIRFFETGDGILLKDIPTRSNATVRVVGLERSGGGDQRERLKVTLGEPSLDVGGFTRGSLQAQETFTVRAPPSSASTGLAGTGWFFDKDHFGPVPFNVPPGVERCSLRITTLPWQANAKTADFSAQTTTDESTHTHGMSHTHQVDGDSHDHDIPSLTVSGTTTDLDLVPGVQLQGVSVTSVTFPTSGWATVGSFNLAASIVDNLDYANVDLYTWNDSSSDHSFNYRVRVTQSGETDKFGGGGSGGSAGRTSATGITVDSVVAGMGRETFDISQLDLAKSATFIIEVQSATGGSFTDDAGGYWAFVERHDHDISGQTTTASTSLATTPDTVTSDASSISTTASGSAHNHTLNAANIPLEFGIYQFDGDSGDGTGVPVFCENATFSIDPADADSDGLPTTAEFDAKVHPTPIGKSTQSRTVDVDVTGYLNTDASGAIEPGVHYAYFRGTAATNNASGLGVVSVTPFFTYRQGAAA